MKLKNLKKLKNQNQWQFQWQKSKNLNLKNFSEIQPNLKSKIVTLQSEIKTLHSNQSEI